MVRDIVIVRCIVSTGEKYIKVLVDKGNYMSSGCDLSIAKVIRWFNVTVQIVFIFNTFQQS